MEKINTIKELMRFLAKRKKWWLTPIVLMLLLCAGALALVQVAPVAPLIYTLF